jgi:hypothetical protein
MNLVRYGKDTSSEYEPYWPETEFMNVQFHTDTDIAC